MEKEVLVLMLLSVFSLMSLALSPTKNYILERQMLDACGIQAIANISRMQWQSSKDHVLRCYDFAYDGLNRLEESTYAEGADMSQNKSSFDNNQNPTFHYYEKDHLGSVRMVVNENGTIEQVNHYYPFGGVYGDLSYNAELQRNKYVGKEFDHIHGLDLYDHGARMYDAARIVWDRVDGLSEKSYRLCPYLYGQNNPVRFVDKDGFVAIAYDENAKCNILNTLTKEERAFVNFEKNGMIDVSLINRYEGGSENFEALKALANSSINYKFMVADKDINGKAFFDKGFDNDNPQNYSYGVTNLPGAANDSSPDNDVYIFTASFLDAKAQAKNTAHEGYGHAYFYELKQKNPSIEPSHTFGVVGYVKEFDPYFNQVVSYPVFGKNNTELEEQINIVEQQAIDNYEKNNR